MIKVKINNKYSHTIEKDGSKYILNGAVKSCEIQKLHEDCYQVIINNRCIIAHVQRNGQELAVRVNQNVYNLEFKDENDMLLEKLGIQTKKPRLYDHLKAPMPGQIVDVFVKKGDEVRTGQPILILKAMKMENVIKAPHDGVINEIYIVKDQKIDKDTVMVQF